MGAGRPKIQIDWDKFDTMCQLSCTLIEFASVFDCSEDTIERAVKTHSGMNFADYHKRKGGKGMLALRRAQMQKALEGNAAMLIWMGKQRLGQTDKAVVTVESSAADELSDDFLTEIARAHAEPRRRKK